MDDGETRSSRERTSVGVVAPEADVDWVVEAVTDAGGTVDTDAANVADSDAVVAVGDSAVRDLTDVEVSAPVLPVGVEGVDSVSRENVRRTIERVLAGAYEVREQPLVRVEVGEKSTRALFDVALTTAEPATISEFAVDTVGETTDSAERKKTRVARFRADGVVVATPAGSRGYARAAGGPVVVPGSDVVSVVPIAPFATDPDHWVLPLSEISLTVERDDADVELVVDGRSLYTVEPGSTVRLVRDGVLKIAVVANFLERERK